MRSMRLIPTVLCLTALAAVSAAFAARPAYYRAEGITVASKLFIHHGESSRAALEPLEAALGRNDQAMRAMDHDVVLLRSVLPEAQRQLWQSRANERARNLRAQFEALQEKVDRVGLANESAFGDALERARQQLARQGYALPESCEPATGIAALAGGSSCVGDDVSPQIGALWDGDSALKARLDALAAEPWPTVTGYTETFPPMVVGAGTGPGWIEPSRLAATIEEAQAALDEIDTRAQRLRGLIQQKRQSLAEPIDEQVVETIRDRARRVRAFSEGGQEQVGRALWAALDRARKGSKDKALAVAAYCPNPAVWGGCEGPDLTDAAATALAADRKLRKDLDAVVEALVDPDVSF